MAYFTKYICFYRLNEDNILILNTLTSAVDIVDNETFNKIERMINNKEEITANNDFELFNKLKSRGYIFDAQHDEHKMLNYFQSVNKKMLSNTISTDFKICPTMGCNLRCTYCYEEHSQHAKLDIMSDKQLNVIFDYIKKCKEAVKQYSGDTNAIKIGLFGGEPLLKQNYQIVEKVLRFAKEIETKVYITTNGTTINEYRELLNLYRGIIFLQITLDGNKSYHDKKRIYKSGIGTFDEICESIDTILKLGIKLTVRINVDRNNIDSISELKELFDKHLWSKNPLFKTYATPIRSYENPIDSTNILSDSEILNAFMNKGWYGEKDSFINRMDSSVYDVAMRLFKPNSGNGITPWQITYCPASQGAQYCFTPDGSISTCLKCVGNNNYKIGTFDKYGIKIDKSKLEAWTKRDPFEILKCQNCKFVLLCAGGCPFYALKNFGDINCGICNDIEKTLEVYINNIKDKLLERNVKEN